VSEHVPLKTIVTVKPSTVQTPVVVEVSVTPRSDDDVGARVSDEVEKLRSAGSAKEIV
jgi:hypothetical protein